jgi:hypothetical protein
MNGRPAAIRQPQRAGRGLWPTFPDLSGGRGVRVAAITQNGNKTLAIDETRAFKPINIALLTVSRHAHAGQ